LSAGVRTAKIFDANMDLCVNQVRGDCYGFLGVYEDFLLLGGVVGCARGDAQFVLLVERHIDQLDGFKFGI
jgi:hypothetical protein